MRYQHFVTIGVCHCRNKNQKRRSNMCVWVLCVCICVCAHTRVNPSRQPPPPTHTQTLHPPFLPLSASLWITRASEDHIDESSLLLLSVCVYLMSVRPSVSPSVRLSVSILLLSVSRALSSPGYRVSRRMCPDPRTGQPPIPLVQYSPPSTNLIHITRMPAESNAVRAHTHDPDVGHRVFGSGAALDL